LKKYHRPYAKEIQEAVIRGDRNIPALKKLRSRLGLSRPDDDYKDLLKVMGKGINPFEYVTARQDGMVCVGSTPHPIGQVKYCEEVGEFIMNDQEVIKSMLKSDNNGGLYATTASASAHHLLVH
jgi:hypothetical protein